MTGKLKAICTLKGHTGIVWNTSWHPKGLMLASCGEDKTIRLWNYKDGDKSTLKCLLADGHQRTVRAIAWSHCGQSLASASFDATIAIWDYKSGQFECNATLEGHENEVKSVAWSRSGSMLATCSRDKSVWVWEVWEDNEYECAAVLNAHSQDVKKVVWHPHEDILASASYDNSIKLYMEDASDKEWTCVGTLSSHTSTVWSLAFDKTGDRIVTSSDDRTLKIWQKYLPGNPEGISVKDGNFVYKCVCTISGFHTRPIYDVTWCHLTDLIATACGDNSIRIFKEEDLSDRNQPSFSCISHVNEAHLQDINSVQWNPVVKGVLASCSDDGMVKIYLRWCICII